MLGREIARSSGSHGTPGKSPSPTSRVGAFAPTTGLSVSVQVEYVIMYALRVVVNLIVDILYAVIDPRIRLGT